jgi:hypothetical protein
MPATWAFAQSSKDAATPHRRNRLLHKDAGRPVLIHRPTPDDRTVHGISGGFEEALRLLKRASANSAAMSGLRRIIDAGQAHALSDQQVLEHAARKISSGRWVVNVSAASSTAAKEPYSAAHDNDYREKLTIFERDVPHMYLDTEGNVTVGVGAKLSGSDLATTRFVHRANGKLASESEKAAAFGAVSRSLAGQKPYHYRRLKENDLDLAPGETQRLLKSRLERAEDDCRQLLKGWDGYPLPAQLALLDMVYNMGRGGPLTAAQIAQSAKERGLYQFHNLRRAAESGDWLAASRECHRKAPVNDERNNWTRNEFVEAAHQSPPAVGSDRATKL